MLRTLLSELPGIWRQSAIEGKTSYRSVLKSTCQAFCSESKLTTDRRIMSSVQPPLSRDTWSSWHTLLKAETCFAILMIRLMAKSVRLITLCKLQGWLVEKATWLDLARWCASESRHPRAEKEFENNTSVGNLIDWIVCLKVCWIGSWIGSDFIVCNFNVGNLVDWFC